MNIRDQKDFAARLEAVMGLYSKSLSKAVLDEWWRALKHMDFGAVDQALELHTQNPDAGQYPPKPADVIRLMGGTSKDRAIVAWSKVSKAISSVGAWNDVVFDDALIHACIDQMGGWAKLCQSSEKDLPFRAAEFENKYRTALFNPPESYPKSLSGMANQHNASQGLDVSPPMTIGNIAQCREVYKGGSLPPIVSILSIDDTKALIVSRPSLANH
ncbi:hypothetical protein A1OO_08760 [Enterovibrio norvegicus FF-33]|uniref:DUF6475 domain-containing protein n=1 Tax=Enterovibrio norvegicus TaxID=188144 RepID=UPI0002EDE67A|nr:DUF6475 domain-containing protein [Enterovibrio norvegicus]OEE65889.1 hypothetical protein A1OO_08760 [Enterovibrio norvegicus FF-33]